MNSIEVSPLIEKQSHLLGTVLKAGRVLDLFSVERSEWGVSEVAAEIGIARATACQLLATLTEIGLLRRTHDNRYQLGWRMLSFAHTLLESTEFRSEALRAMDNLSERYQESIYLAALDGDQVVCVTNREGELVAAEVGQRLAIHSSAVGKVLVSDKQWHEVRQIIGRRGMPALTPKTITRENLLQEEWSSVRRQGYAYTIEESVLGLCCVAAPIYNNLGRITAAICISVAVDVFRFRQKELVRSVRRAGTGVSANLGHIPSIIGRRVVQH